MAWVVDTCLLIDVAEADPAFGIGSAKLLDTNAPLASRTVPGIGTSRLVVKPELPNVHLRTF